MTAPLQFKCIECASDVFFTVLDYNSYSKPVECSKCHKKYQFGENIVDKLKKFEALCRQIQESKEIFSQSAIAIDVDGLQVKMPFQLLLTRLSSILELNIGGEKTVISCRVDTRKENSAIAD